ncbi:MAG: hypothetical protein LBB88_00125, partial [Planctomycetaceae bacterium]|nr:hypothetical protein [Planctomycetaceae bacterium]
TRVICINCCLLNDYNKIVFLKLHELRIFSGGLTEFGIFLQYIALWLIEANCLTITLHKK